MRYHYQKPAIYAAMFGRTYDCDHPIYNHCTLFEIDGKGLAVIQQRFNKSAKTTRWTEIDPWLNDVLYTNPNFKKFFDERAGECEAGLYPTVTIRQIMWALKIKPIPRKRWETCFDRREV